MTKARKRRSPLGPLPGRILRAVLYIRVSALMGRGGEDFHSPEIQLSSLRKLTAGMVEVEVIYDIDRSGTTFSREGVDRTRALAQARAFDVLAVFKVDRFGRNTLESLLFLNELADHGVTIVSAKEHVDTSTPSGRKHLTDLLSGAQLRSEEIGESWMEVFEARARVGKHHARPPLGYRNEEDDDGNKDMVIDPVTGPMVEDAFKRYAAGDRLWEICTDLRALTGISGHPRHLKARFRNPVYIGKVTLNGVEYPGAHDALIDEGTWERVQNRLVLESGLPPRIRASRWTFLTMTFCAHGHPVYRQLHHKTNPKPSAQYRLVCSRLRHRVTGGCEGIGSPADSRFQRIVLDRIAIHVSRLRVDVKHRADAAAKKEVAQEKTARFRTQITKVRNAITKLTTAWAMGEVDEHGYRASLGELRSNESSHVQLLSQLESAATKPEPFEIVNAAEALLAMWDEMTDGERARAVRTVVKRIVIRKGSRSLEPLEDRVFVEFL